MWAESPFRISPRFSIRQDTEDCQLTAPTTLYSNTKNCREGWGILPGRLQYESQINFLSYYPYLWKSPALHFSQAALLWEPAGIPGCSSQDGIFHSPSPQTAGRKISFLSEYAGFLLNFLRRSRRTFSRCSCSRQHPAMTKPKTPCSVRKKTEPPPENSIATPMATVRSQIFAPSFFL